MLSFDGTIAVCLVFGVKYPPTQAMLNSVRYPNCIFSNGCGFCVCCALKAAIFTLHNQNKHISIALVAAVAGKYCDWGTQRMWKRRRG